MDKKSNDDVALNIEEIRRNVDEAARECGRDPKDITIMAVTKTVAPERVNKAIENGITLLGENRAQELLEKYDSYDKDGVDIHFIGHLQTNKVRQIIDKVTMIHSVDSVHLAQEIDRQAGKAGIVMKVLAEVNIGGEESKSGISPEELPQLLEEMSRMPNLSVQGLMTIPPVSRTNEEAEHYFCKMSQLFIDINQKNMDNINMNILSMGMSGDYRTAIKYGATIVRIGTALFGSRR